MSGFWHGASWNFIAWGFMHTCGFLPLLLLSQNRNHVTDIVAKDRKLRNLKELGQMASTFAFVTLAWIFFRADDISVGLLYIKHIGVSVMEDPSQFLTLPSDKVAFVYILPLVISDWYFRRDDRRLKTPKNSVLRVIIYWILLFAILSALKDEQSFIYFQF